jgi:hypothetical protein
MSVPDQLIPWIVFVVLMGLFVLVGPKASAKDVRLQENSGYKRPMFAFEMNAGEAERMFNWNAETKQQLSTALIWDYLFIFVYVGAMGAACFIAARFLAQHNVLSFQIGILIIALQLLAGLLDVVENYALLQVLEKISDPWPHIARWCAIPKFGLIILGLVYALVIGGGSWIVLFVRKATSS